MHHVHAVTSPNAAVPAPGVSTAPVPGNDIVKDVDTRVTGDKFGGDSKALERAQEQVAELSGDASHASGQPSQYGSKDEILTSMAKQERAAGEKMDEIKHTVTTQGFDPKTGMALKPATRRIPGINPF